MKKLKFIGAFIISAVSCATFSGNASLINYTGSSFFLSGRAPLDTYTSPFVISNEIVSLPIIALMRWDAAYRHSGLWGVYHLYLLLSHSGNVYKIGQSVAEIQSFPDYSVVLVNANPKSGYTIARAGDIFMIKLAPAIVDNIPDQACTAGIVCQISVARYVYNATDYVINASVPVVYNPKDARFLFSWIPDHTGPVSIGFQASNVYGPPSSSAFTVQVQANREHQPQWLPSVNLPAATAGTNYQANVSSLVKTTSLTPTFTYRIDTEFSHPAWLVVDPNGNMHGTPTESDLGQHESVTLIAHSNTGGDSDKLTKEIFINYDFALRPEINEFQLEAPFDQVKEFSLVEYIKDPTSDPKLQLKLLGAEPSLPDWIQFDSNRKILLVNAPRAQAGQFYGLKLVAENTKGGVSQTVVRGLKISVDPSLKPAFTDFSLPPLLPGQLYDFDLTPYVVALVPYKIRLMREVESILVPAAKPWLALQYALSQKIGGINLPDWILIDERNHLVAMVPINWTANLPVNFVIETVQGGCSNLLGKIISIANSKSKSI